MIEILLTIIIVCLLFGSTTVFWLILLWPAVLIVGFVVYLVIKGAVEESPTPPTNATDYHAWTPPLLLPPPRPLLKADVDSLEIERWKAGEEINCLYDEGHCLCEDSLRCYEKVEAERLFAEGRRRYDEADRLHEGIARLCEEVAPLYESAHGFYEKDRAASLREQAECHRNLVKGNRDWRTLH